MKIKYLYLQIFTLLLSLSLFATSCGGDDKKDLPWGWDKEEEEDVVKEAKPRFIWIDAAANFPDFADSKENIRRDLTLAKEAGFTDIVVDVRPTCGDILYKSSKGDQVEWLGAWLPGGFQKVKRTATWDYLQAFIDVAKELDLKIYAGFNTFVGGNFSSLGGNGMLYRDPSKKEWATQLLTTSGLVNTLDLTNSESKFFNPNNTDVQEYLFGLLEDLAAYKDLDGIILDRGRFDDLDSDFSDYSKRKFEDYLGYKIQNFPSEVMAAGTTPEKLPSVLPTYFKQWLEFRAKTIHDFMENAKNRIKAKNSNIKVGVYVGAWYSTYFGVGVNWASPSYDPSSTYPKWASNKYKNFGYADHMDVMLMGAYAPPTSIYGTNEWSVQGFCVKAKEKIKNDAIVVGGPDIGNGKWAETSDAVINSAITQSVDAAMGACDGYFLFDMIHLKKKNQWPYVKSGIDNYLDKLK